MAGNESDGRSSSFNDGMISAPNSSIPTVNSATILLLARLNLDKNDMLYSRIYQCFSMTLKMANYFILTLNYGKLTSRNVRLSTGKPLMFLCQEYVTL